jgi:GAF domain-containing protein
MDTGGGQLARTLQSLARSFVPALGDFCLIHRLERQHLRCVAGAHATREGQRLIARLACTERVSRHDPFSTVAQVVRSGRALVRSDIVLDRDPARPRMSEVMRRLGPRSAMVAPLVVRDRVLGAITLCYSDSGRRYNARHLRSARRLARFVAGHLAAGPTPLSRRLPALRARV